MSRIICSVVLTGVLFAAFLSPAFAADPRTRALEDLCRAAEAGNLAQVEAALAAGTSINGTIDREFHGHRLGGEEFFTIERHSAVSCAVRGGQVAVLERLAAQQIGPRSLALAVQAVGPTTSMRTVDLLLGYGADPTAMLMRVAAIDRRDLAERALSARADANAGMYQAESAEMIELLFSRGATARALDGREPNALSGAARQCNVQKLYTLLGKGMSARRAEARDGSLLHSTVAGWSEPWATARDTQCEELADWLLATGANVNARDAAGNTPLHVAAANRSYGVVVYLLRHGADLNARNSAGCTPLCAAIQPVGAPAAARFRSTPAEDVVGLLLSRGADLAARTTTGESMVCLAADGGEFAAIDRLAARGADLRAKCPDGASPLLRAAARGAAADLQFLLDRGADVNERSLNGVTPLMNAARSGNWAGVDFLLAHGAQANAKDRPGMSPLLYAARAASTRALTSLLDGGAVVDEAGPDGETALMIAVGAIDAAPRHLDNVKLLLDRGADPRARNVRGESALDIARRGNRADLLKLLERRADAG
jgi:ankyrin repeat protein